MFVVRGADDGEDEAEDGAEADRAKRDGERDAEAVRDVVPAAFVDRLGALPLRAVRSGLDDGARAKRDLLDEADLEVVLKGRKGSPAHGEHDAEAVLRIVGGGQPQIEGLGAGRQRRHGERCRRLSSGKDEFIR